MHILFFKKALIILSLSPFQSPSALHAQRQRDERKCRSKYTQRWLANEHFYQWTRPPHAHSQQGQCVQQCRRITRPAPPHAHSQQGQCVQQCRRITRPAPCTQSTRSVRAAVPKDYSPRPMHTVNKVSACSSAEGLLAPPHAHSQQGQCVQQCWRIVKEILEHKTC